MPYEERLGSQPGKDMSDHKNWVNFLEGGNSRIVHIHLPREVRQFDTTEEALKAGLLPFGKPRGWSIGEKRWKVRGGRASKADLILDTVDIPIDVEAYVANMVEWSDSSVNNHLNISAQYYRKPE